MDAPAGRAELVCNGINGATGSYWLDGLSRDALAKVATNEQLEDGERAVLKAKYAAATETHLGVIEGVDPRDLAKSGWGVIFNHDADPKS